MSIYEKIKRLCEAEGFFVSNIGNVVPGIKVDKSTVSHWKKGNKPGPATLKAIAEYFGKPIEYFYDDYEEEDEPKQFYADDDVQTIAQELYDNPAARALFNASKKLSKQEMLMVASLIESLTGGKNDQ